MPPGTGCSPAHQHRPANSPAVTQGRLYSGFSRSRLPVLPLPLDAAVEPSVAPPVNCNRIGYIKTYLTRHPTAERVRPRRSAISSSPAPAFRRCTARRWPSRNSALTVLSVPRVSSVRRRSPLTVLSVVMTPTPPPSRRRGSTISRRAALRWLRMHFLCCVAATI